MICRGEIYFVDLNPTVGREQSGRRPVLVLSIDYINAKPLVVTVVPGTDSSNIRGNYPTIARVPASESGLPLETAFLCFQVRALDHARFSDAPAGKLSSSSLAQVERVIRFCLGL